MTQNFKSFNTRKAQGNRGENRKCWHKGSQGNMMNWQRKNGAHGREYTKEG